MSAEANDKKRFIRIRGANENNLKNLSVDIPRDQFVVLTGLSGSGKSSLAFDTIYAEGQRRYMESLSSYARQFLGQMEKPDVESIEGLPPAISIDQKSTNRNPRSTVGTVTEIYDYFRLLYARVGIPHCPKCGREIRKQTVDQMVDQIMTLPERQKIQLLAPVVRGRKGTHVKLLDQARRSGYVRVQIDGNLYELSEEIKLDKNIKHNIEIVVDRLIVKPGIEKRLSDSIETVLDLADGLLVVDTMDGKLLNFSQSFSCPDCGISIDEIEPRSFSFNNPFGACPQCLGLGYKMEFDIDLMIPDKKRSINEGAIAVLGWQSCTTQGSFSRAILDALAREYEFSLDTPFCEYPKKVQDILIHGTGGHSVKVYYKGQRGEGVYDVAFPGLIRNVEQRYRETGSEAMKQEYESFMRITPCTTCKGQRLKKESLAVTVADKNIYEVTNMPVQKLQGFLRGARVFGENKVQEIVDKYDQMPSDVKWHMIGHLQRNKVKYIVDKVAMIHSVDSLRLAETIEKEAAKKAVIVPILIEVNVAQEESKFGLKPEEVLPLIEQIADFSHIRIKGLMTIAPYVDNAEENREIFRELKKLSVDIAAKNINNVTMSVLSMGMTGDYMVAVQEGATMVRVGTGIFGARNYAL